MNFRKSALASAIAMAVAAPASAGVTIEQRIEEQLDQLASNLVELESGLQVSVGLDLEGNVAASTQLGSLQANVLGWGTTGGSATSALDVTDVNFIDLTQVIDSDDGDEPTLSQYTDNWVRAQVTFDGASNIDLRGISQIGVNVGNAAAFNLDGDVTVIADQRAELNEWDEGGEDGQATWNEIIGEVNLGAVNINGGYLADPEDEDITRSIQLGSNTLNALQLYSIGELAGDVTVDLDQDLDMDDSEDYGSIFSLNGVFAFAENAEDIPLLETQFGGSISNIDQIGLVTQNNLSVTLDPTSTLNLQGAGEDGGQNLDPGLFFMANEMVAGEGEDAVFSSDDLPDIGPLLGEFGGVIVGNPGVFLAVGQLEGGVLSGDYDGLIELFDNDDSEGFMDAEGFGDFSIDDVAQTLVLNLNSVSINGPTVDDEPTAAGDTTIGLLDPLGEVQTFEQDLGHLHLDGMEIGGLPLFNNLFAFSATGDASVTDFAQTSAVSGNTFSTSGNLIGASLGSTDYYPGTIAEGNYGEFLTDIDYDGGEDAEGDLSLDADLVQAVHGQDIVLLNVAGSFVEDNGVASLDGSQIGSVTLNSLSVAGNGSGYFGQGMSGDIEIALGNAAFAGIEDRGEALAQSLSQTGVTSLNVMGFGSVSSSILYQEIDNDVDTVFSNSLAVGGSDSRVEMASLEDVTQAVISRVNAISAINVN